MPITTPTVFILGAGASAPYGFYTGERLLDHARSLDFAKLADLIAPLPRHGALPLLEALARTLESSIDAMLEYREDLAIPGKALIARLLLEQEREAFRTRHAASRNWYRTLFAALNAPTVEESLSQPVTFVTYNYDRSLEYSLAYAWGVKFGPDAMVNAVMLRRMFIHLHGQLGFLPEIGTDSPTGRAVAYGGDPAGITESDVLGASKAIEIIHEPQPDAPQFLAARAAIANAKRLVFLGFGFAPRNLERLQLAANRKADTAVFACAFGFTANQRIKLIFHPLTAGPVQRPLLGEETEDVYQFLRLYPQALE